ncbi:unnamed protein product [Effrenium voratum]|nr:unnamed protein product [Effrenium voratum]
MFLTLCQELRELFQEDDTESVFSFSGDESEDEEEGFEHRRPREPHALDDYNADEDEYEMVVEPELPDVLARKEMQMIQKQMAQLSSRLQREGPAEVLDHYHKVKADLFLELVATHRALVKQDDTMSVWSSMSTCDTDLEHSPVLGELVSKAAKVPPSAIMGPQARRTSRSSAFDSNASSDVSGSIV